MPDKYYRFIFWSYIFFLLLIAVLPLNSSSSGTLTNVFIIKIRLDYFLHAILFFPWILFYSLNFHPLKFPAIFTMFGTVLLMAFATEGVQYFLTYRSYNINDLLSNFLGVLLGACVLFINISHAKEKAV